MSVIDRWGVQGGPVGLIILRHVVGGWGLPRRWPEPSPHSQQPTRWPWPLRTSTAPHRPPTPQPSGSVIVKQIQIVTRFSSLPPPPNTTFGGRANVFSACPPPTQPSRYCYIKAVAAL